MNSSKGGETNNKKGDKKKQKMQTQDKKKKGASKIDQLLKQFNDIIVLVVDHARSVECDQARERGTQQNKNVRTTASMHTNKKKKRKEKQKLTPYCLALLSFSFSTFVSPLSASFSLFSFWIVNKAGTHTTPVRRPHFLRAKQKMETIKTIGGNDVNAYMSRYKREKQPRGKGKAIEQR